MSDFIEWIKVAAATAAGTGLGLAIVKHVALQHEAEVFIKSLPDMGTTIEIIFAPPKEEQAENAAV